MVTPTPTTLEGYGVRLEPMSGDHAAALAEAVTDGELWRLWFTSIPGPADTGRYVEEALRGLAAGSMLPWVVCDAATGAVIGSTRFHDIVPAIDRVEIGYTWYGARWQGGVVNPACKRLLLAHAFESLGCQVVGLRTDRHNRRSQRAIEALGARRDGVLRHFQPRPDGSARDTVIYSILRHEWPDVRRGLELRLRPR